EIAWVRACLPRYILTLKTVILEIVMNVEKDEHKPCQQLENSSNNCSADATIFLKVFSPEVWRFEIFHTYITLMI
ncbi:6577_t:CDS:2, partial [Gigaspora margarita]